MNQFAPLWNDWLEEHGPRLLLFARQQTRCEADAEDVLQTALVKTLQVHRREPDQRVLSLVYTNIRRCAIDLSRQLDRRKKRETDHATEQGPAVAWFELPEDDTARALQVALTKIPDTFREVITLKIWGDQTFDEVGKALSISPHTAASRYRYGMEALRKSLASEKAEIGF